jgi:hypothetical protein
MKAVKTNAGSCDVCGKPAAYAQLLPAGKRFLFCEVHVPREIKLQAEKGDRKR